MAVRFSPLNEIKYKCILKKMNMGLQDLISIINISPRASLKDTVRFSTIELDA